MERTVVYLNLAGKEIEVGLLEVFTPEYLEKRGDLVGIEQEARTMLGDDFIRFGWWRSEAVAQPK